MSQPPALAPDHAYPVPPGESARSCLIWGWSLIGGGCVLALLPIVKVLILFIGPPLILAAVILAIVAICKDRTDGGVALLLFSIIIAPFAMMLPLILAVLGFGAAKANSSSAPPPAPVIVR